MRKPPSMPALALAALGVAGACQLGADPAAQVPAPLGLTAAPIADGVLLSWRLAPKVEAAAFRVFQGTAPGQLVQVLETPGQGTSALIFGLEGQTTYYFSVAARLADGRLSSRAVPIAVRLSALADVSPLPPSALQALAGDGLVQLRWWPSSDPDLWRCAVLRGTDPTQLTELAKLPITEVSYLDSGLINDTTYYYAVAAIDRAGHYSPLSGLVAATPGTSAAPGPPTGLQVWPGQGRVTLTWAPDLSQQRAAVEVFVGLTERELLPWADVPGTATSAEVVPLTNLVTYYFALRARDATGLCSPLTVAVAAVPSASGVAAPPPPPTDLQLSPGNGRVRATWLPPQRAGLAGFRLRFGRAPHLLTEELLIAAHRQWAWLEPLPNGLPAYARIEALGADGQASLPSPTVSAVPSGARDFGIGLRGDGATLEASWRDVPASCQAFRVDWFRREPDGWSTLVDRHQLSRSSRLDILARPWPCARYWVEVGCLIEDQAAASATSDELLYLPAGSARWWSAFGAGLPLASAALTVDQAAPWWLHLSGGQTHAGALAAGDAARRVLPHTGLLRLALGPQFALALATDSAAALGADQTAGVLPGALVTPAGSGLALGLACQAAAGEARSERVVLAGFWRSPQALHAARGLLQLAADGTGSLQLDSPATLPCGLGGDAWPLRYRTLPDGRLDLLGTETCVVAANGAISDDGALLALDGLSWQLVLAGSATGGDDASSDPGEVTTYEAWMAGPDGSAIHAALAGAKGAGPLGLIVTPPLSEDAPAWLGLGRAGAEGWSWSSADGASHAFLPVAGAAAPDPADLRAWAASDGAGVLLTVRRASAQAAPFAGWLLWLEQDTEPLYGSDWDVTSALGELRLEPAQACSIALARDDGASEVAVLEAAWLDATRVVLRGDVPPRWLLASGLVGGPVALASFGPAAGAQVLAFAAPPVAAPAAGPAWALLWRQVPDLLGGSGHYPLELYRPQAAPLVAAGADGGPLAGPVLGNVGGGLQLLDQLGALHPAPPAWRFDPPRPFDGLSCSQSLAARPVAPGAALAAATSLAASELGPARVPSALLVAPAAEGQTASWRGQLIWWLERQGAPAGATALVSAWQRVNAALELGAGTYELRGQQCDRSGCRHLLWRDVALDQGAGRITLVPPLDSAYPPLQLMLDSQRRTALLAGVETTSASTRVVGWGHARPAE